jgi:broad specificity phosphatase PhoE
MSTTRQVEVVLIPGGPTAWDSEHRLSGQSDIPLAPTAVADLQRSLEGLGTLPARVLCGPEEACRVLAKAACGSWGRSFKAYVELRELGLGLWEGMRTEEAAQRYASAFAAWREDPASVMPPEGESIDHARHRLLTKIAGVLSRVKNGESLAIVARPMALEIIAAACQDRPITDLAATLAATVESLLVRRISVPGDRLKAYRPATIKTFLM